MTPQQKAQELLSKYTTITLKEVVPGIFLAFDEELCKKFALIAVDELLEATKRYDYTLGPKPSYNDYWLKVKYQIENL
jgi:hypothetical protein